MKKIYFILFTFVFAFKGISAAYVLKAGGTYTNPAHWGAAPNGTSGSPASFSGANTWSFTANNASVNFNSAWSLPINAIVIFGNGVAAFNAVLTFSAVFNSAAQPTLKFSNNATLTVQADQFFNVSPTKTQFLAGSNCAYAVGSTSVQGMTFNNLIINSNVDTYNLAVVSASNVSIASGITFSVSHDATVTISGAISGSGDFFGDGNAGTTIKLTGTGNVGNITFNNSTVLSNFNLALANTSSSVTLGSDFSPNGGVVTLGSGILNVGTHVLSLDAVQLTTTSGSLGVSNSSTVYIGLGSGVPISGSLLFASTANTIGVIEINNGGQNMTLGSPLYIYNYISVLDGTVTSAGNLNITASNGHNGFVAPMGTTGAILGNVVMNSFFPSGNTGWCLMGTNGVSGKTIGDWQNSFPVTCTGCTNDPSSAGGFYSIQDWNTTTCDYDVSLTSATSLSAGKGFWVYLGSGLGASSNLTWSFTGPINQGPVNYLTQYGFSCAGSTVSGVSGSDGINLVANPYPCPIDLDVLGDPFGVNAGSFTGTWYCYSRSGGAGSYVSTVGGTNMGNIVPAGVGFFADNTSFGAATLVFDENMKTFTGGGTNMYKGTKVVDKIKLKLDGLYNSDEALFSINPAASSNYGKYDALKMFSSAGYAGGNVSYSKYTSISSYEPQSKRYLSINSFPSSAQNQNWQILVKVNVSGTYTISATEFENYSSCAILHDKLTNVYTDLKLKNYVFNISDTTSTPRFELLVCSNGAAPVSVGELYASSNLSINQDADGVVVKTNFNDNTKSVVSAYNIIGQKIMDDITIEGKQSVHLNIADKNQVVLIKVVNDKESLTKKVLMH